jgi:hypothetical protein
LSQRRYSLSSRIDEEFMETPYRNLGGALEEMTETDKPILGSLGYTIDSIYNVIDPSDFSRFLVHFEDGSWASVFHRGRCAPTPDLPVWIGIEDGEPVIVKTHAAKMREMAGVFAGAQDVGLHTHARFSGMEYAINSRLFEELAVRVIIDLIVEVIRGPYYFAGQVNWWTTGTLDLADYLPVDAGQQYWCIVCIDTETNPHTLIAFVGENYLSTDILQFSAIPNVILPTTVIPLAAVRLADDTTALVERDFVALYSIVGALGVTSLAVETDLLFVENVTYLLFENTLIEDLGDGAIRLTIDPESSEAVVITTDATMTTLQSFTVEENEIVSVDAVMSGGRDDESAGIGGRITATARRATAGNVTLVGSDVLLYEDSASGPTFTVDVDTGTQTLRIRVTGVAAQNWRWKIHYRVMTT